MGTLEINILNSKIELTDKQLDKINQLTPASLEEVALEDITVVRFRATDNLLNRSYGKWALDSLPVLKELLLGLPLTLDHDWEDTSKSQALIFDAEIRQYQAPKWAVDRAGNGKTNRAIINQEGGYFSLEFDVAFPIDAPAIQALRFGKLQSISIGGFQYKEHLCPLCGVSFDDEKCPHLKPDKWWGINPGETYETSQGSRLVAPYFIRSGVYDLGEASLVLIPNYPAAGVVRRTELKDLI